MKRRKSTDVLCERSCGVYRSNSRILLLLILLALLDSARCVEERRCGTLDIRNYPWMRTQAIGQPTEEYKRHRNCTVLEGSFMISMITSFNTSQTDYPRFLDLREITGSVLIFQVKGLKSLRWLFPNLRVVGGQNLIQHYSFIVYQNEDLEELGLDNLRVIRNGGIRISDNHKMCHSRSIDWKRIQQGPINDIFVDDASEIGVGEGSISPCTNTCPSPTPERCHKFNNADACWSPARCQLYCPYDREDVNKVHPLLTAISPPGATPTPGTAAAPKTKMGPGCADSDWSRCHDECIAGCTVPNDASACYGCRTIAHGGRCIPKCPAHLFTYMDRRCITKEACEGMSPRGAGDQKEHWRAVEGKCHYHCPEGYEEDPANTLKCRLCNGECHKKCPGNIVIDSLAKAKQLSRCNVIDGYLEIEMRVGIDSVPGEELTAAFQKIQVIDGYLLIRLSTAFVNLHMFKGLKRITGKTVYRNKYAVAVYENHNLAKLFAPNSTFTVDAGHLQFQNNRMLCFKHIEDLMKSMGRDKEMNDIDQSSSSNGDKAICDEELRFTVNVSKSNPPTASTFSLTWEPYNTADIDYRKFLGYEVKYKEVPAIDYGMSIDDDRSACSDSWNSYFQEVSSSVSDQGEVQSSIANSVASNESSNVHVTIDNVMIKPDTIYAYYVVTSMVRHAGAKNAVSGIGFLRTAFGIPDQPKLVKGEPRGTNKIFLEWDAPVRPNGQITHYMVSYRPQPIDIEAQATSVCEKHRAKDIPDKLDTAFHADMANNDELAASPDASVTVSATAAPSDTCSAKGCCTCMADPKQAMLERQSMSDFENAVQNQVFVQHCNYHWDPLRCDTQMPEDGEAEVVSEVSAKRRRSARWEFRRRSIYASRHRVRNTYIAMDHGEVTRRKRSIEPSSEEKTSSAAKSDDRQGRLDAYNEKIARHEGAEILAVPSKINVTGLSLTLDGLKHYTEYFISIAACQNASVKEATCSTRKAWRIVGTEAIEVADIVDNSSIVVSHRNGSANDIIVTWEPPSDPNGAVLAYKVKAVNTAKQATPIELCISVVKGWSPADGALFEGLNDGDYKFEIRTVSMLGMSQPAVTEKLTNVYVPGFWTLQNILITLFCVLLFLVVAGTVGYYFVKKYYGKKVKEYATQLISANPEYLSQNDVYKADHWELQRSDLNMDEEIGRGTFGKVYRGSAHNVRSVCGEVFGVCAIKTVAENANSAERLHFLLEASVMKQFNSSFIVKLYGVVSDGQPVLVVMEMMEKGNLRDFLRSRRPNDDMNVDNLPVPLMNQYFEWAAQIADGMAYLESLRFCHRDLAARNCMVHANETVKIGDFGMARDLYYHEYYKPTGKRLMPVRWMAPESLKDGKFDTKSDVWSYGIVLYEMMTLGQQPYQGLHNEDVLTFIGVSRKVLDRPTDCPDFWYDLMVECWKYQPKERPNFHQIVTHLIPFVTDEFKKASFVLQNPDVEFGTEGDEEEHAYAPEPHAGMQMMVMEEGGANGDGFLMLNNRAGTDEPGWGEGDSLAEPEEAEHAL